MNTLKCANGMVLESCFDFIYASIAEQGSM